MHTKGPVYQHGLNLITAWISNGINYKLWSEIFFHFQTSTVALFTTGNAQVNKSHTHRYVTTFPFWNYIQTMLVKGDPGASLTDSGLVTPYGDKDLGQDLFRWWLVAWQHHAIIWTNVALSTVKFTDNHPRVISQEILQLSITKVRLKICQTNFHSNLNEINEKITSSYPDCGTDTWCHQLVLDWHFKKIQYTKRHSL